MDTTMKKLSILLLLFSLFFSCSKEEEPTYESIPLSEWVKNLNDASTITQKKSQEALISIGTKSVPYMEKIIKRSEDNSLKIRAACVLYFIDEFSDEIKNHIKILKSENEILFREVIESNYMHLLLEIRTLNESVNDSWDLVENQLQRRYNIIPEYIEVIRQLIPQENKLLSEILEARKSISEAKTVSQKITTNNHLANKLLKLSDSLKSYPQLSKNIKFVKLRDYIIGIENRIAIERRRYNHSVMNFNKKLKQLPFPELFNYHKIDYYGINSE